MHHNNSSDGRHHVCSRLALRRPVLPVVQALGGRMLALGSCKEYPVFKNTEFLPAHASINHSIPQWEAITIDTEHEPPGKTALS